MTALPHERHWFQALENGRSVGPARTLLKPAAHIYRKLQSEETPRHPRAAKRHLRLILSSIAVYKALINRGLTEDDARHVVNRAAVSHAASRAQILKQVATFPFAFTLFRRLAPCILKADHIDAAFSVKWRRRTSNEIAFDVTRCMYLDVFSRHGCGRLTEFFCAIDDMWYAPLAPNAFWERAGTLATGTSCCDFHFQDDRYRTPKEMSSTPKPRFPLFSPVSLPAVTRSGSIIADGLGRFGPIDRSESRWSSHRKGVGSSSSLKVFGFEDSLQKS